MVATADEDAVDSVPDLSFAKEFYAKYELKDILGKGVSSTVRRCVEKSTHVEYAVKIIDLTQDKQLDNGQETFRQSTKKEITVLQLCAEHPNIIELHDVFESNAFIFLVFEICKKGELFDYLTEVVTLSEKRTRQVMRQLLDSVEFVHSKNIVHRDLKPENILLDDNFNVKLSDFGFACIVSSDTELRDLCGTPGYLSPEALKVSMYDNSPGYGKPTDMWASGVIMYTLLVGCPPFWHRKQMVMLRSIMEGKYTFGSPEWDDIGENAKDLVSKLLVVDPKERLTASGALAHPFFKREERQKLQFKPRRKFKAYFFVIMAMNRIRHMHMHPPPLSMDQVRTNPYGLRMLRKVVDHGAFKIYGHWVKKGENQNRAALFENLPKRDIQLASSVPVTPGGLPRHFDRFAPLVVVGDRIGRLPGVVGPELPSPKSPTSPSKGDGQRKLATLAETGED